MIRGKIFLRIFIYASGVILSLLLMLCFYQASRQWPADRLVRRDPALPGADAVILLMGNIEDRAPYCAELVKRGYASHLVFTEPEPDPLATLGLRLSEGETTFRYLKLLGLSDQQILFNKQTAVSSTAEEIRVDLSFIAERLPEAKRLLLCTSWYHSSRAYWISQKANQNRYQIESVPTLQPASWYAKEIDFLMVFNEYLKWTYYWLKY